MNKTDQGPATGSTHSAKTLGCVGLLLSSVAVLLAMVLVARTWPESQVTELVATSTPIFDANQTPPPPEERAFTGKFQPADAAIIAAPVIPSEIDRRPIPATAADDYHQLMDTSPPAHDYFTAAQRLGRYELGQRQNATAPSPIGERRTFQTADGPRPADLVYQTDAIAYWVEVGLPIDLEAIASAAQMLEARYLPLMQAGFGREWSPGVDLDPRITVLHVIASATDFELGYFSDENEFPRSLFIHSNEREMIYLNMSRLEVGTELYFGTLIHELQHLAQWNLDPNEQVWLNESFSQLAETLSGLDTVEPAPYLEQPNVRLDRWSSATDEVYAHYGGAYLFARYLWQRAGEQAVHELVRLPDNGLGSVETILEAYLPQVSLEDFSIDWAVANYLDSRGGEGKYGYDDIDLPSPGLATRARRLPFSTLNELEQSAVDYIDLDLVGPVRLTFVGDTVTPLVDTPPPDDGRFWFAALDNSSAATLFTRIDLPASAVAALEFDLWHDLEAGWDVAYLSVSADGGLSWQILGGQSSLAGPYGPAWSGQSQDAAGSQAGWVHERVDLAAFAGQSVLLRFDALSDFEEPSRGLAIANLAVSTAEASVLPLTWQPDGFTETGRLLPQLWGVRVIRDGARSDVIEMRPDATGMAQLDIELGPEGGAVVVMPLTSPSAKPARYWFSVESLAQPGN